MADSYVQLQPDANGKQVDMDPVATQAGSPIYRQRADLVGISGDALSQLLAINRSMLAVMRAVLRNQQITQSGAAAEEEDFLASVE